MSQTLEPSPTFLSRQWKPYLSYKRSGVEWLGEVPEHWGMTRLKFIAAINPEVLSESTDPDYQIQYVDIGNVSNQGEIEFQSLLFSNAPSRARRRVIAGDVIISTVRTYLQAIAYFKSPESNTIVSTGFAVLRPCPEVDSRFLYYTISSRIFISHVMANSVGVSYPAINPTSLADLYTWIPPIAEQKQIASFLDRETTRIDTLITKKRQLITLLQKKRDALVDSFVIKVSDPYEAIKKADMSWLNDLPDDWGNVRLKFLSSFITSGSRGWAEYYSDEGSVFLRIGNLSTESIDLDLTDLQFVQPPKGAEGQRTRVYPNDLLISITALIGAIGVVPSKLNEAYVNQHTALVRLLNQHIHYRWAAYCVFSSLGQKQLGEFTSGGTKDGLTLSDVGNLLILIPPDKDQELYAKEIDRKLDSIQLTLLKTKESIRVLEKYRTTLITAAITGKIDVRGEVN